MKKVPGRTAREPPPDSGAPPGAICEPIEVWLKRGSFRFARGTTVPSSESSKRLPIDRPAGADGDEINQLSGRDPVDDSEPAHPEASWSGRLIAQLPADRWVGANEVEARPHLAFDLGMGLRTISSICIGTRRR
jgi:hypothetical protein